MKKLQLLLIFCLAIVLPNHAQDTLYSENFEATSSFVLNTTDLGGATSSDNVWIENNIYAGGSGNFFCSALGVSVPFTVPAAPQQPSGITNSPTSTHLHITPQIAINAGGNLPAASYVAADGFCIFGNTSNFTKMTNDISTLGSDSVVFDFWWTCGGSSLYYGEVYYSTDGGTTWLAVNNPASGTAQWINQTTWTNTMLSNPAWANQSTLRFGFRFITGSTSTGSEADPGFAIDDIEIIGYAGCTPTNSSITTSACDSYTTPSGQLLTSSTTFVDTIPSTNGCDSIITIFLTMNNTTANTISPTACDSYTSPSGQVYTSTATFNDTLVNGMGCDSVITVNLTINNIDTSLTLSNNTLMVNQTGATYQWIDCGNGNMAIPGETGPSFTPTSNGNYAVVITDNGCTDTSSCYQMTVVGIEQLQQASLVLQPNPTNGSVRIQLPTALATTVRITNLQGQVVWDQNYPAQSDLQLDLSTLSSGVYFVQVHTEQKTWAGKLMKR